MLEAMVSLLLQDIHDLVLDEAKLLLGVPKEVKDLKNELTEMKILLQDADGRENESKVIAHLILKMRKLVDRVENVIELYAFQESSRRRRGLKRLLRRYSCILKECYSTYHLGTKILDIKSELASINKRTKEESEKGHTNKRGSSFNLGNQNLNRRTYPNFEIDDCFIGKEDDMKKIESLMIDEKGPQVISVWGMGGIGKTAIAKRVYRKILETKKGGLECFAWVCITQQCQIQSVLEDVYLQLTAQKKDDISNVSRKQKELSSLTDNELITRLCNIQRSKRCLIVLDDLWDPGHWKALKKALGVQDSRSKILVTTRKSGVVDIGKEVELGLLTADDAWKLLKKKAFPEGKNTPDFPFEEKELVKIGKEMVQKCGYLALAICLLGGVLRKKSSIRDWESVCKNISASLYRGESEIDGVLNLSYKNLRCDLKPCFLSLGILKEDESIDADELYGMWIAQGLISNEDKGQDETLMDVAEHYLRELASASIVQVETNDLVPSVKWACGLHDVVRELCLKVGKKEGAGVKLLDYEGGKFSTSLQDALTEARHLSIHFNKKFGSVDEGLTSTGGEDAGKHLRSLRVSNDVHWEETDDFGTIKFPQQSILNFKKFKFLRELVIVRFNFDGGKLPKGITNLVLLRCLRLQDCRLDELPRSIRNFVYLETLDLQGSLEVRIPNVLKKLCRLRHLILPGNDNEEDEIENPAYDYDYKENKIENDQLRLDEVVDELETLAGFNSLVHELKCATRMKNLRSFSGEVHNNESLVAIVDAIENWDKLQVSVLVIRGNCHFESKEEHMNLKKLFTCPNLYYLVISVEIGKLPASNDFFGSKLVTLVLSGSKMEDDPMGILGKLPCLLELCLGCDSFVGEVMTCHALSFPRLERLELSELPNLKEWRVELGAMPRLSEIQFCNCPALKMFPDGLRSTLKRFTILQMPDLAKRVLPMGEDFGKLPHGVSLNIHDW